MAQVHEDLAYKTKDHQFRSVDEYAQGKYDITTRWLAPLVRSEQVLLNIGCGSGEYNATAHALNLRVIACEPEPEAFALAKASAPLGVDVRRCGLLDIDVPPADFIVMHDVLEHIEDDVAAVERIHALLQPGGVAVISVPAYQWLFGQHDVMLGHFRRYTRRSLRELFADRFDIEAARYYGAAFIPIALWFSRLSKQPYPVEGASRGLMRRAMRWVCQLESRVPLPVGTSVLLRVRKRA